MRLITGWTSVGANDSADLARDAAVARRRRTPLHCGSRIADRHAQRDCSVSKITADCTTMTGLGDAAGSLPASAWRAAAHSRAGWTARPFGPRRRRRHGMRARQQRGHSRRLRRTASACGAREAAAMEPLVPEAVRRDRLARGAAAAVTATVVGDRSRLQSCWRRRSACCRRACARWSRAMPPTVTTAASQRRARRIATWQPRCSAMRSGRGSTIPHSRHSLSYAYPFTHRPLVEFMMAIPGEELSAPGRYRAR